MFALSHRRDNIAPFTETRDIHTTFLDSKIIYVHIRLIL